MSFFSGLACTLWPEWAWAIDAIPAPLAKRVENRAGPPWRRLVGGPWIALHAGAHVGGRKGWPAHREGIHGVAYMANLAGCATGVMVDGPDFWQIVVHARGMPVQASDPETSAIATHGLTSTDGTVKLSPRPEDNERPIVTSAILGLFRVKSILPPGQASDADGIRGWKIPEACGWVLDYRRLPEPIPCSGAQGFWDVQDGLLGRDRRDPEEAAHALRALRELAAESAAGGS